MAVVGKSAVGSGTLVVAVRAWGTQCFTSKSYRPKTLSMWSTLPNSWVRSCTVTWICGADPHTRRGQHVQGGSRTGLSRRSKGSPRCAGIGGRGTDWKRDRQRPAEGGLRSRRCKPHGALARGCARADATHSHGCNSDPPTPDQTHTHTPACCARACVRESRTLSIFNRGSRCSFSMYPSTQSLRNSDSRGAVKLMSRKSMSGLRK